MNSEISPFVDRDGFVATDNLVQQLHITKREFATAVGLRYAAIVRKDRYRSVVTQQRLRQTMEILMRIQPWAGSLSAAWSWYRTYPISALGSLTSEELVAEGRSDEVRAYLAHIAGGGYA